MESDPFEFEPGFDLIQLPQMASDPFINFSKKTFGLVQKDMVVIYGGPPTEREISDLMIDKEKYQSYVDDKSPIIQRGLRSTIFDKDT